MLIASFIVIAVLAVLIVLGVRRGLRGMAEVEREKAGALKPSSSTIAPKDRTEEIHTAIIAATVAALMDAPYRIRSVTFLKTENAWTLSMLGSWSMEGRQSHFSSHKIR